MAKETDNQLPHDTSLPKQFSLKEKLSIIKAHRPRRGTASTTKRYVLFVLDTSGSIGEEIFNKTRDIVADFIPYFCHKNTFAVMTFGSTIYREMCFNCDCPCKNQPSSH